MGNNPAPQTKIMLKQTQLAELFRKGTTFS